jgi:hypothetical protein
MTTAQQRELGAVGKEKVAGWGVGMVVIEVRYANWSKCRKGVVK